MKRSMRGGRPSVVVTPRGARGGGGGDTSTGRDPSVSPLGATWRWARDSGVRWVRAAGARATARHNTARNTARERPTFVRRLRIVS